ncbi:MAG: TIGR00159 family protein [Ruminococcaceae bacterium]|nr:TIGR00159 family protein [Oscillospiraceae bacterium]
MTQLFDFFSYAWNQISSMRIMDIIDILLVSVLLYYFFRFIKERRAGKLAAGIVFLITAMFLSEWLEMYALNFILENIIQVGIIALMIIFQPEIRSILEKVGGNSMKSIASISDTKTDTALTDMIGELSLAASELSASKTGALIVIERSTKLGDEIKTGVVVDAQVSSFLIGNIFFNKAPLHDGAMIIRDNKIYACGCFLPLSTSQDIIKELGTRHRAGIGVSEVSDAVVVIVSEETGMISMALDGKLQRGYDKLSLKEALTAVLVGEESTLKPIKKIRKMIIEAMNGNGQNNSQQKKDEMKENKRSARSHKFGKNEKSPSDGENGSENDK